jgi:hypothetical protein
MGIAIFIAVTVALKHSARNSTPSTAPQSSEAVALERSMASQIDRCSQQTYQCHQRSAAAQTSRNEIAQGLADVENFDSRLKEAIQRGDDENRWPVRVAGRSFARADAVQAASRLDQYIASAHRAIGEYDRTIAQCDSAAAKIDQCSRQLQTNRARLQQFGQDPGRFKLELDRLDAEVTAAQQNIPTPAKFTPVDIDSLLK